MKSNSVTNLNWIGSERAYLNLPSVEKLQHMTIGRYGGNTESGAHKNEDGLLVWQSISWEFVTLIDSHSSCDSTELIIATLKENENAIKEILDSKIDVLFDQIEKLLLQVFKSDRFKDKCRVLQGEASCLICIRKENVLWWFSVGDCQLFLIHDDLEKWGQVSLNQRNYYEWIGKVNTFEQAVPSYSLGRRELRRGINYILLITDGYLEAKEAAISIPDLCRSERLVVSFLNILHCQQTVDSTTLVLWAVQNELDAAIPFRLII
ncbi:protein phosphatase 2C domain-containing protein [Paenibacillus xerothermodurans]|uniref:Protein phosphatase 2C domain-containing protein n=1 Tax=Paenibacillus xerothermodurans TaxID=1977292 RepID=A0A2W1NC29_PAEXE|nr:protein phosphatase 2C domain-containing protein [Paenibacillus xerothermodurans]PZE22239.1 protein phosphatase 2C domain-containing protein [Paenibacillus xerothermodurans]